jgi:hypothetical protein
MWHGCRYPTLKILSIHWMWQSPDFMLEHKLKSPQKQSILCLSMRVSVPSPWCWSPFLNRLKVSLLHFLKYWHCYWQRSKLQDGPCVFILCNLNLQVTIQHLDFETNLFWNLYFVPTSMNISLHTFYIDQQSNIFLVEIIYNYSSS